VSSYKRNPELFSKRFIHQETRICRFISNTIQRAEDNASGADYITERNADYVKNRYHSPADEVSDNWDVDAAVEDLILFFNIGNRLANSVEWPQWYEGNEFRGIREASMADKK